MNNIQIEMFKNFIKQGGTPQKFIENMLQNNSNPMLLNLINAAKNGDNRSVEVFARNLFKEQGRDFDKEYEEFMKLFK